MAVIAILLMQARHGKVKIVSGALKKFPEIRECYEVFGSFDILAKVEVETHEALKSFMQNKLQITEGIKHTETLLVCDEVKKGNGGQEGSYSV